MTTTAPLPFDPPLAPPGDAAPLWRSFDHAWYACAYLGAHAGGLDAAGLQRHYHEVGAAQGHSPNRWFDEGWYRLRHPDVAAQIGAGRLRSGFQHYCLDGFRNRSPHWLFDSTLYLGHWDGGADNLDPVEVGADDCVNLYGHFLRHGATGPRQAHMLFDPATYRRAMAAEPGAAAAIAARGAWHHFINRIWFDGRDAPTSPWFDPEWYVARHPAAAQRLRRRQSVCALHDYLAFGRAAGASPLPQFDEGFYLGAHSDAAEAVQDGRHASGYDHFLRRGAALFRQPAADIDLRRYHDETAAARVAIATGAARDAFTHLVLSGGSAPRPGGAAPACKLVVGGHVDSHGHAALAGGWGFLGWLPPHAGPDAPAAPDGASSLRATARFAHGEVSGLATLVRFPRPDLPAGGAGMLLFLPGPPPSGATGGLVELEIETAASCLRLPARVGAAGLDEPVLVTQAAATIAALPGTDPALARLRVLLARRPYAGVSTLAQLQDPVFFQIDETILCPAPEVLDGPMLAGLAFNGWMLTTPGTVAELRLVCAGRSAALEIDHVPRLLRPDALESVGAAHGLAEPRSGFLAYVPDIVAEGDIPHIAITTARGEIGYHPIPPPRLRGMEAMQYLLARAEPRYDEVPPAFDHVLGPAIARLNAERLRHAPGYRAIDFGPPPAVPRISVIVTLHRRLDFLEYQLAFLSRHAHGAPFELIYVLDDPPRARQLEVLAASAFARFQLPFRMVVLAQNLGFGPANNLGLALARAPYVCFLNSDVFPGTPDWMERLVARLRDTPELGAVGPMLLFEDGTVQHQGMRYERLEQFGDFHFPMHPGKGWRPRAAIGERVGEKPGEPGDGLRRADAITGACIVMARWLAQEMGGFDPAYPVGDFEDSDLCLRLRTRGLQVAVDTGVRLYHLERQSQIGPDKPWRMNMTLYNGWLHDQRWGDTIDALPAPNDDDVEDAA